MPSEITSIRLVGGDKHIVQLVKAAGSSAFPEAKVFVQKNGDVVAEPVVRDGREMLVLSGDVVGDAADLASVADHDGLPRWAVIVLGEETTSGHFEVICPQDLDAPSLARAFRSTATHHRLRRENARLRGDLLSVATRVNHDLKTPLNGILAAAEAMKEVLQEKDPESVVLSGALFSSVEEMVKLMNRISFVLKASAQANPLTRTFPMGDVVWTVLQRLERKIRASGLQIEKPEVWPEVQGVESWMEVVWANLFSNILEHAAGATKIELGWVKRNTDYLFWIKDNGPGFSTRRQNGPCRPFHTLHILETGHGLGLSIVHRLVYLQGGSVSYEPVPEGGAQFSFTLPLFSTVQGD